METEPVVSWKCPVCLQSVQAVGEPGLFWVVREHIQGHISQAGYDAVIRAAMDCRNSLCGLGRSGTLDKMGLPVLTVFDRSLLHSFKISWDD